MAYSTEDFLKDVRIACRLSDGDTDWADAYLLRLGTQEMRSSVMPWIISLKEDFGVRYIDIPVTPPRARYAVSHRSSGGLLRDLKYLDSNNVERNLTQKDLRGVNAAASGMPSGFTLQGNTIVLSPKPQGSGEKLRQYIRAKPSSFVTSARKITIASIDRTLKVIGVNYPSGLTSASVTNVSLDFISQHSPCDFIATDVKASVIAGSNLTFDEIPEDLEVGDLIFLAGETSVAQMPEEVSDFLVLSVAIHYFFSMAYSAELSNAIGKLKERKAEMAMILTGRIEGAPKELNATL